MPRWICRWLRTASLRDIGDPLAAAQLPRPGSVIGKLYRLTFALAACWATAYLAAYGIIGLRLWSY